MNAIKEAIEITEDNRRATAALFAHIASETNTTMVTEDVAAEYLNSMTFNEAPLTSDELFKKALRMQDRG